jgi:formyl-CoA transferase
LRYPADFARMSATPGHIASAAPLLGQHNQAILGERLGYSAEELEAMRSQGVI